MSKETEPTDTTDYPLYPSDFDHSWNWDYINKLGETLEKEGHKLDRESVDCEVCSPHFSYDKSMMGGIPAMHNLYRNAIEDKKEIEK